MYVHTVPRVVLCSFQKHTIRRSRCCNKETLPNGRKSLTSSIPSQVATVKRAANILPEHSLLIQLLYIYILLDGGILLRFPVLCFKGIYSLWNWNI